MLQDVGIATLWTFLLTAAAASNPVPARLSWKTLQGGLEYGVVGHEKGASDDRLHLVRIDLSRASLEAVMASADDGKARRAGD